MLSKIQVAKEINTLYKGTRGFVNQYFSFAQTQNLPEPVKKYFSFALKYWLYIIDKECLL